LQIQSGCAATHKQSLLPILENIQIFRSNNFEISFQISGKHFSFFQFFFMARYPTYPAEFQHKVLSEYRRRTRGHTFADLARKYHVIGGASRVRKWFLRWKGTVASLRHIPSGGPKSILTEREKKAHILNFVEERNRSGVQVTWNHVWRNVIKRTKKKISYKRVQRIGHDEFGITSKATTEAVAREGLSNCTLAFTNNQ